MTDTNNWLAIRGVVDGWAIWRDSGDWERLRTAWHPDGRMVATWFEGTVEEFIVNCRRGWDRGALVSHALGGFAVQVAGERAIAQTRCTLNSRGMVEGVECDVACIGRFYDLFERRAGRWAIVSRRLTYERDRIDTVVPGAALTLDPALLARFPVGYRHLAYMQTQAGMPVFEDLPGLRGAETEALYGRGRDWLAG